MPSAFLFLCNKAQLICHLSGSMLGIQINFRGGFKTGNWVVCHNFLAFSKSIIATITWHIWKARCDAIFRVANINTTMISLRAFHFAKNNYQINSSMIEMKLQLNNFTSKDGLFLFSVAHWNEDNEVCFIACFIANSNYNITLAVCCPLGISTKLEVEVQALIFAFRLCVHHQIRVQRMSSVIALILKT